MRSFHQSPKPQGETIKAGIEHELTDEVTSAQTRKWAALHRIKTNSWPLVWCVYAIGVLVLSSFDNQAGSAVLGIPQFRKDFGHPYEGDYVLPAEWQSAYSGAPVASAIVGSLGSGVIADRFGRKRAYALCYLFMFTAITLETVSTTNQVFFAGKLVVGFAIGGFTTVSMTYIAEISPVALRGILTGAAAIAFAIGPLIVSFIVNETGTQPNRWAYRTIFVCQYGVSAVGACLLPLVPESPWWLVAQRRDQKAIRSLRRLGHNAEQAEEQKTAIFNTLENIRQETDGASYLECFRKSNLRRTIIAVTPLSIQAFCGIYFVSLYSTYYQQLAGYSTKASFSLTIALDGLSTLGNITSWLLINRVGRRNLTIWGIAILTALLCVTGGLAVAATPSAIKGTVALLLVYCYIYNATIGATAYALLVEVATTRLRAKTASMALALQNALFTMWAFVLPFLFNPDQANLGAKVTFIFGGLGVFCTVYLWFYQPEIAGRSFEELDEMFMKRIPARQFKGYRAESKTEG
ncbi:MFS hexose transporter [Xylariaceae sp. FL0016]|nr:MFS hexose transporter [Xylariaceae sp. FL0016]